MTYSLSTKFLYGDAIEPIFTRMIKIDLVFINQDLSRFSAIRIDQSWNHFSEIIREKYRGFILGTNMLTLVDATDI